MPTNRITMRKLKEILRLRLQGGLSLRQIERSTGLSVGAVQKVVAKARVENLDWTTVDAFSEAELNALFYGSTPGGKDSRFAVPDWGDIYMELATPEVTKLLLWEEYKQQHDDNAYSYSQFCALYAEWRKTRKRSMRQIHRAGEKLFVDYAGSTVPIINPDTGEIHPAQIFVAVLGASNYTYAEATWTQGQQDWLMSHVRAFEFFGGVPQVVVPDNLKSAVIKAHRYEPDLNPAYQQLAAHYDVAVVPARSRRPKDKSKAEVGVQVVERWILARLRKISFFTLAELNQMIHSLLQSLNERPFKQLPGNRIQAFERLDRDHLKPLPRVPYEYTDIKTVKVAPDYHVAYEQHYYSVPHHLVGVKLELHASDRLVTCYFQQKSVATHPRKRYAGHSTNEAHMPSEHLAIAKWSPGYFKQRARRYGSSTEAWMTQQLESRDHVEQAYRSCMGLLSLADRYPVERIEAACKLALQKKLLKLKQVTNVLKSNQDQLVSSEEQLNLQLPQDHENVRGPETFH